METLNKEEEEDKGTNTIGNFRNPLRLEVLCSLCEREGDMISYG